MGNSPKDWGPGLQWLGFIFIWWGIVLMGSCPRTKNKAQLLHTRPMIPGTTPPPPPPPPGPLPTSKTTHYYQYLHVHMVRTGKFSRYGLSTIMSVDALFSF